MIRFLLRFLGLLLLALAFIFVIYDGMKSIADRNFYATALEPVLDRDPRRQPASGAGVGRAPVRHAVEARRSRRCSTSRPPAVFAVLGIVLIVLGRKKKPLIGYARD